MSTLSATHSPTKPVHNGISSYYLATFLFICFFSALCVNAQNYPTKSVRVIVGFAPGGATDIIARYISPNVATSLGQSFVIENHAGADSLIASELVARSEGDGYVISFISSAHTVNPSLYKKNTFDANKDFSAICMVGDVPNVLIVHPSIPAKTMKEFIALAKKKKGELHFGATASITFLGMALLNKMAGIETVRIAYKGAGPAMVGLLSGEAQFMLTGIGPVYPLIKANKVRALAISIKKRTPLLPEVPTIDEAAVPGYFSSVWYGVVAPARTPRPIIDKLNSEIRKSMNQPETKAALINQAIDLQPSTPDEMRDFMKSETEKWVSVVKESRAQIE